MLLLVTDTSGKNGFVGLVRAGAGIELNKVELIEEVPLAGGTFSAQLVPQISGLLEKHGLNKKNIDAFVVVSGPGSFTGLRVGLAAIKALAEILQKPIVAVSLLEVVARFVIVAGGESNHASDVRYTVALDAGRGEAFVGQFKMSFAGKTLDFFRCESESLLSVQSLAEWVQSGATPWIVTPDATLGDALKQRLDPAQQKAILLRARPHSVEVSDVGWHKLKGGETVSPEQLDANYIRRSDAEIFAKPTSSS